MDKSHRSIDVSSAREYYLYVDMDVMTHSMIMFRMLECAGVYIHMTMPGGGRNGSTFHMKNGKWS